MATFGIPDAIQALTIVVGIALDLINEGKELANIYKEMQRVKEHLSQIETRMKNPKSPLGQPGAKMKSLLEQDCQDIKDACGEAKKILSERKRMHSLEFGSKIVWIRVRIPELKDIISGFHASTTSVDKKITLLLADAAERAEAKAKATNDKAQKLADDRAKKLESKLDLLITAQENRRTAREAQAKNTLILVNLLRGLDKKAVEDAALGEGDGKKFAAGWVNDLVKAGMTKRDAEAGLKATLDAVKSEKQEQKVTIKRVATDEARKAASAPKPVAKKAKDAGIAKDATTTKDTGKAKVVGKVKDAGITKDNGKVKDTGTAKDAGKTKDNGTAKDASKAKDSSAVKDAGTAKDTGTAKNNGKPKDIGSAKDASKPKDSGTAKNAGKATQEPNVMALSSILCVDGTNGDRSIIAQTYLELLRVWTVNTQMRWLFERVHSAGCMIPTALSKSILESEKKKLKPAGVLASKDAIGAIAGGHHYFHTTDPDEKGAILKRMREHKSEGLLKTHFQQYKHIICFDERTQMLLEKMKEAVAATPKTKVVSEIHYFKECEWYRTGPRSKASADSLLKVTGQLKVALKKFLKVHFKWEVPAPAIADGLWRTVQVPINKDQREKLTKDDEALVKRIFAKKECRVYIASDTEDGWLLFICGPKGNLRDAQKLAIA